VQGIQGSVSIDNPSYYTDLFIDDSADTAARTVTINSTYVSGVAPADINFHYNDLSHLTIYAGSGGNTINVVNTPTTYAGGYAGYTWLQSGTGNDTVNVFATAGGYAGGLYIDGQNGIDNVFVGGDAAILGHGTLANINGFVYTFNPYGSTNLSVDDSSDTVSRAATLNSYSLTGLSTGPIYWVASPSGTDVTNLYIFGSNAGSTYNVTDTPNIFSAAELYTGAGNDTVNIAGSSGFFSTDNRGGYDSVYVGNGTLAGINGTVYVTGAGSTYLYVQDYSDTTAHNATLTRNTLVGMSTGAIWWDTSATAMGGVTYLSIRDGIGASNFSVSDTPNALYATDLFTGAGDDSVFIAGTTGALNVNNGGDFDSVDVGDGTLNNISGAVNLSGAGSTYLYAQDGNDVSVHFPTLTGTSLTGLSRGAITWVASAAAMGGVTFLSIVGSSAGSIYSVTDTPNLYYYTNLDTGAGNDEVYITGTTGPLWLYNGGGQDTVVLGRQRTATVGKVTAIKGYVDVYGSGTVALTVDDSIDATGRSATLSTYSLTGLSPAPIYFDTNLASLTINGGNGSDTLTVASSPAAPVIFNSGNGTDTLVGPNTPNTWSITGTDVGNLNGTLTFSRVANLVGGSDVDTLAFGVGARMVGINGGGAPAGQGDWLDYTAYPGAVSVNLATGKATGVTATVSGIQNVFGGNHGNTLVGNAQGNILIGGSAADTITGGSGRSLLVGGAGSDTITGGAADDILIGGSTTLATGWHKAALMSILAEWQSADDYATRLSVLRSGYRALAPTIVDDAAADHLTGSGGMDWFFAGAQDTLTDRQTGEAIN
jgi:hypothetical protein